MFSIIKKFFTKAASLLTSRLLALFGKPLSEETFRQLEQILYEADLGRETARELTKQLRVHLKQHPETSPSQLLTQLSYYALEMLRAPPKVLGTPVPEGTPRVLMAVGVNGSGKTTSLAKLAKLQHSAGKRVLLVAADTFRAAAVEQLSLWAERLGVDIVKGQVGSDPSCVVYDALCAAKARNAQVVLIDTAGRLQNKSSLMHELEKMKRTCNKLVPKAPHETLLILDATTGQNGIEQVRTFHSFTPLTGLLLSKVDGSAKGGVLLPLYREFGIPILWLGVGEKVEDLTPFDPASYTRSLFQRD